MVQLTGLECSLPHSALLAFDMTLVMSHKLLRFNSCLDTMIQKNLPS